jgi:hypothetical protein
MITEPCSFLTIWRLPCRYFGYQKYQQANLQMVRKLHGSVQRSMALTGQPHPFDPAGTDEGLRRLLEQVADLLNGLEERERRHCARPFLLGIPSGM